MNPKDNSRFIDYHSKEKELLLGLFTIIPMMDKWIANIVESYIYEWVEERERRERKFKT